MTAKEQSKLRKLLALALDPRNQVGEADAAAVKALALARAAKLSAADLAGILHSPARRVAVEPADPIGAAVSRGMATIFEELFKSCSEINKDWRPA